VHKYSTLFLSIIILFLVRCPKPEDVDEYQDSLPAIPIEWNSERSIVCYGTTLTWGATPSLGGHTGSDTIVQIPMDSTYPNLLGQELVIDVHNSGFVGWSSEITVGFVDQMIENMNPALVLVEFGLYEFLADHSAEEAGANIDTLLEELGSYDVALVLLSFTNPTLIENTSAGHPFAQKLELAYEYYQMLSNLALKHNVAFVDNLLSAVWDNSAMLMSDQILPNNSGNIQMKENVFHALHKTYEANGMLKE